MRFVLLLLMACIFWAGTCAPTAAAQRRPAAHAYTQEHPQQQRVRANPTSKIYHNASCRHYTAKGCTQRFNSAQDAQRNGYRACKKCGG